MSPKLRQDDVRKRLEFADDRCEAEYYGDQLAGMTQHRDRDGNDLNVGTDSLIDGPSDDDKDLIW